jgi:hypothetical protein
MFDINLGEYCWGTRKNQLRLKKQTRVDIKSPG